MTVSFTEKKSLFILIFICSISFLIYFSHSYSPTQQVPITDELTNEQTFSDVLNDTFVSDPCICKINETYLTEEFKKQNEKELEEARSIENQLSLEFQEIEKNKQNITIPDKLPPSPSWLLDKINKNLLENRVLIVATANYGMRNHVYNWIESLRRTGETKFLIFCFDQKLYDHLVLAGYEDHASLIPDIWFHLKVESDFKTYFTQEYRAITHSKTLVVQQLLYLDINVFFSDVDIVWLRRRMVDYVVELLMMREETHVLFQQEGLNQQEVNSGFYLMRSTIEMKKLLAETIHIQDTVEGKTQQGAMNSALNNLNMDLRTTSVVLLDILHFPNGYVYYDRELTTRHGIKPFIVHANYLVGEDKKKKLIQSKMWYIKDKWLDQLDKKFESLYQMKELNNTSNS